MSDLNSVIRQLSAARKNAAHTLEELSKLAGRMSKQDSSTLFGVSGGLLGVTSAYFLSIGLPVALSIAGPLMTSLGIVAGILIYRGRRGIAIEKRLEENRIAAEEILRRIRQLPKNAPKEIARDLWHTYGLLSSAGQFVSEAPQHVLPSRAPSNSQLSFSPPDQAQVIPVGISGYQGKASTNA